MSKNKDGINIPVNIGDVILTGKWKNHKEVVKEIGEDEHGLPTINGKGILKIRIEKLMKKSIKEAEKPKISKKDFAKKVAEEGKEAYEYNKKNAGSGMKMSLGDCKREAERTLRGEYTIVESKQIDMLSRLLEKYTGKKVVLREGYRPYKGGAGPTSDEIIKNNAFLLKRLQKLGVQCQMDNGEYAKEKWDGNEKMIVVKGGNETAHISYDRWGFVSDELDLDQSSLGDTIEKLQRWLGPTNKRNESVIRNKKSLKEANNLDFVKAKLTYDKSTQTFSGSEKYIPFATSYNLRSPKGGSKIFNFENSTGPEFDPNTKWIYKSNDGYTLEICNDAAITQRNADAYLKGKTQRNESVKLKENRYDDDSDDRYGDDPSSKQYSDRSIGGSSKSSIPEDVKILASQIADNTAINNNSASALKLASFLRDEESMKQIKAILRASGGGQVLSLEMISERNAIIKEMLQQVKSTYGIEAYKLIYSSF
jgi:hypothetical protein